MMFADGWVRYEAVGVKIHKGYKGFESELYYFSSVKAKY